MGSSGTGRLSDYTQSGGGLGGKSGGSSGTDKCIETIQEQLEEVALCDYYISNNNVPPIGSTVSVVIKNRIAIENTAGELIGYLPTQYNYLVGCIQNGYRYSGSIQVSTIDPLPTVLVHLRPQN